MKEYTVSCLYACPLSCFMPTFLHVSSSIIPVLLQSFLCGDMFVRDGTGQVKWIRLSHVNVLGHMRLNLDELMFTARDNYYGRSWFILAEGIFTNAIRARNGRFACKIGCSACWLIGFRRVNSVLRDWLSFSNDIHQ